jgi:DnaK suppressor protein
MLNDLETHHFKQALLKLRSDLLAVDQSGQEAAQTVELDQTTIGRVSRMDALQAQQMAQETARRRQIQMQKIDSALRRMDAREYGYCLICDEEIAVARLEFDPASTRCINCMDD